jgi:hypothetical protein
MANTTGFLARARVLGLKDREIAINPLGTNYELRLLGTGNLELLRGLKPGQLVDGTIRVSARKVWTVPSGGNFIAPIFGPPRTIQGRVRAMEGLTMIVHAGTSMQVTLPIEESAFDLVSGPLAVGVLVNVTALPGATFELAAKETGVLGGTRASTIA